VSRPEPSAESKAAFIAFLGERKDLDADVEYQAFLTGGWVQHHLQWIRRSERPEKKRPR